VLALSACQKRAQNTAELATQPTRIVSLDYCADQYVLKLADRQSVLAISPDGVKEFSYLKDLAVGVPTVSPVAEDVLSLKPDLVVRSYGGGPNATAFFERAGVPVLQIGWASTIDGESMGTIPSIIRHMAHGLGVPDRGEEVVQNFRSRLENLPAIPADQSALYMTPSGVTTGTASLVSDMMETAGYSNFESDPGWRPIPLERLVYEQPEIVAAAFFETFAHHRNAWSASRHPIAQQQLQGADVVPLRGAWTSCGGWFIMDAIEALAQQRAVSP